MQVILYLLVVAIVVSILIIITKNIKNFLSKTSLALLLALLVVSSALFMQVAAKDRSIPVKQIVKSQDNQDLEDYKNKDTIVVGTTANYSPWTYKQKGQLSGFQIDLIKEAVKLMGKKIQFKVLPNQKDLLAALNNQEIDIISDFTTITSSKQSQYNFSIAYSNIPLALFAKKGSFTALEKNDNLTKLNNLVSNQVIVAAQNSDASIYAATIINKANGLVIVNSNQEVINSIIKSKNKIGITDVFSVIYYNQTHPKIKLVYYKPLLGPDNTNELVGDKLAFMINKDELELKKQLDIALSILKNNGKLAKYSIKYFKQNISL
ncbi:substrate-binding periplasmic protein [Rickettsiales bacterium LUAb2]